MTQEIIETSDSKNYHTTFSRNIQGLYLSLEAIETFLKMVKAHSWYKEEKTVYVCNSLAYTFIKVSEFQEASLCSLEKLAGDRGERNWRAYLKRAMEKAQEEREPEA